jgi:hypothetical protein
MRLLELILEVGARAVEELQLQHSDSLMLMVAAAAVVMILLPRQRTMLGTVLGCVIMVI